MKDARDYRVLYLSPDMEGVWSDAIADKYVQGGYEGVYYRVPRETRHASLDFLATLPNLRFLYIAGAVADDSAVDRIPTLEHLTLLTGCKRPLAVGRLNRLESLAVQARPNSESIVNLSQLQRLLLAGWRGTDLHFLGDKPHLTKLRLDGRPTHTALAGIEGCTALRQLEILDHRVPDLRPLRTCTELNDLLLSGPRRYPPDNQLDLEDLVNLSRLRSVRMIAAGQVMSLAPLRQLGALKDLRIEDVAIADGDLGPLLTCRAWVPEATQHLRPTAVPYTHTIQELRNARAADRTA